ncbi:MAG: autotransporter domain-containing protein [Endomicrobia bacterium]|nr:autotransporter domain-containing protein [Endomicrobiia bacterium]
MKRLIKFIFFGLFIFWPANIIFAVDAYDYTSLNGAINAASDNPVINTIDLSTPSITLGGHISPILNKSIIFQSLLGTLIDGSGSYRGFTASNGSNLAFSNVNFQNFSGSGSGAFLNLTGSTASFSGQTAFTRGYAGDGGAVSANNNSYLVFSGAVIFDSNFAADQGGGFYSSRSTVVFNDYAEFNNNTAEYTGGGFHADYNSIVSFNGHASFINNKTIDNNGAGFYAYRSTISFTSADFVNNVSSDIGGGFYAILSDIVFTGTAAFTGNFGKFSGGAFSSGYSSTINFYEKTFFDSNSSYAEGGAIDVSASTITFSQAAEFNGNAAISNGGAIYAAQKSYLRFDGSAAFTNNKSENSGGAIAIFNSDVVLSDAIFDGNAAGSAGGAVYISGNSSAAAKLTVNTNSKTIFRNNKAGNLSNALYLDNFSLAEFNTDSAASVEMYDSITGSGNNSNLVLSGAGTFSLYGSLSAVDVTLSGTAGSSFNLMNGGMIDSGNFAVGNGSRFNSVNNTSDAIKVLSLTVDGTLAMELFESGINDRIFSSGTVNLGSSSALEIASDITDTAFRKKTYMLINSPESINGAFGSVSITTPSFAYAPLINYGDVFEDWITLTLLGNNFVTDFSSLRGISFNQRQAAKTYDALSASSTGDLDAIISLIEGMDENEQKKALAQASGYFLANVIRSASADAEYNEIYDRIKNHCMYANAENGVWAQLRGAATTFSKDENSLNDFNDTSGGVMIGFDRFSEENDMMLGVYGKYITHDIKQGLNSADITNAGLGIYGGFIKNEWEVKALVSGSRDNYSTKRKIPFIDRKAKADFDGTTFGMDIEGAMKFSVEEYISIRPYIGIEAKNSHYNGFKEKDAGSLNLEAAGDSYIRSAVRTGGGVVYDNNIFSWRLNGELKYLLSGESPEIESVFTDTDVIFRSRGAAEGNIIFGITAGTDIRITKELKFFVNGSYYGADHFQNLYGNIGLRWNFCHSADKIKSKVLKPKKDNYDPASYILSKDSAEPKEVDAVITFEEKPLTSDEYDPALELLNSPNEQFEEDGYDAAFALLYAPKKQEEPVKEINMEDETVVEEQQKEAALRRSKPVLKSFSLNMANFATGKSMLTEKAKNNIRLQAAEIKKFNFEKITIEGHTDSTGSAAVNKRLSRERAKAVFDIFAEEGIPTKKMSYIGFSSLLPVATNTTIEGRAKNRRVEIFVE